MIYFTNTIGGLYGAGYNLDLILYFTNSLIRAHNYRAEAIQIIGVYKWLILKILIEAWAAICFNYSSPRVTLI